MLLDALARLADRPADRLVDRPADPSADRSGDQAGDRAGGRPWRLVCAGSATRDRDVAAALAERARALGLADRVTFVGELDAAELAPHWDAADLFVLASRYEGYGMVFDEALARALPIVASGAGAVADTVPGDAGVVVPPDDVDALAAALARWFDEPALRERLRAGAARARTELRDWRTVADDVGRVLDACAPTRATGHQVKRPTSSAPFGKARDGSTSARRSPRSRWRTRCPA